jgi:hypothetical protein
MFKPKKYIRLDEITGLPKAKELKHLLFEAKRSRGCTVEQPWRSVRTSIRYSLTATCHVGGGQPVWSLYEGESSTARMIWSQPFDDIELLGDVIGLSLPPDVDTDIFKREESEGTARPAPRADRAQEGARSAPSASAEFELPDPESLPQKPASMMAGYKDPNEPDFFSTPKQKGRGIGNPREPAFHTATSNEIKPARPQSTEDLLKPPPLPTDSSQSVPTTQSHNAATVVPPNTPPFSNQPGTPGQPPYQYPPPGSEYGQPYSNPETQYGQPPYPQGYPPPPYGQPQPPYGQPGYPPPPPGYPQQPGYPQPPGYPPGYAPPPGYPPGYAPPADPNQQYNPYPPGQPPYPQGTQQYPPQQYPPGQPYPQQQYQQGPYPAPQPDSTGQIPRMAADSDLIAKRPNILLGEFLVQAGLIPEATLNAALQLQELVRSGSLGTRQAAEAVRRAHNRGGVVEQFSASTTKEPGIGQIDAPPLGEILVEAGLIRFVILKAVLNLQEVVRTGALTKEDAIQAFIQEHFGISGKPEQKTDDQTDRNVIDLLCKAKLIQDQDLQTAVSVRKKHGGELWRILVAAGKLDNITYDAAKSCQTLLAENRLKIEQAIIALHFCQRSRVSFDEAIEELGWEKP